MAMSALAPTEKSEHLIYTILPLSLSLCLVSFLATSLEQYLSIITIVTPIATIILYEIGPDDWWVKRKYRKMILQDLNKLARSYLAVQLLIQSWNSTVEDIPSSKEVDTHISGNVKQYIDGILSGYIAKRRFWRIRSTIFLSWSIPFIIVGGLRFLFRSNIITFDIGFWLFFILVGIMELSIYLPNRSRKDELLDFLKSMVTFSFWQIIVIADRVRNPSAYDSGIKRAFRLELDSVESILFKGDWISFRLRWDRTHDNMLSNIEDDCDSKFWDTFFMLWGSAKFHTIKNLHPKPHERRLNWYILLSYWYGEYYPKYTHDINPIAEPYIKSGSFNYPVPDGLLKLIPVDSVYDDLKATSIVKGLYTMIFGTDSNLEFEHLIRKFIDALSGRSPSYRELDMDPKQLANYIFDYAIGLGIQILSKVSYVGFKSVYDRLGSLSDKQVLLHKYIASVETPEFLLNLLRYLSGSNDILTPEMVSLIESRVEENSDFGDIRQLRIAFRRIKKKHESGINT